MSERKLVVMVERKRRDRIAEIATALSNAGMTVEKQLEAVGIITGHADDKSVTALSSVDGVQSLRDEGILHVIGNRQHGTED